MFYQAGGGFTNTTCSATFVINGKEVVFKRKQPDIIQKKTSSTHYFEVDNFEKDWNIPLLFHYTVLNGRFAKKGSKLCGHICPCVLKHNNTTNSKSYGDEFEQKDVILLSIWLTRCNSPTIHLVVYVPGRNNCVLLKGNVIAFLKTRYCDTSATFDEEAIKK